MKNNHKGNASIVSPSGEEVSEGDAAIQSALNRTDTTAAVSKTDEVTATTTASTKPVKIRFAKGLRYSIVVYLKSQSVAVYTAQKDGKAEKLVKCFTCSSGKDAATPTGDFSIIGKHRWRSLEGDVFGQYCSRIHGHILFHSTPYLKQKPSTLDDAEYDKLGMPVSHGCVRMSVSACKWIYDNAPLGTPVSIVDAEGPEGSTPPSRNPDSAFSGWDPTDKWSKNNPYYKKSKSTKTTKTTKSKDKTVSTTNGDTTTVSTTTASVSADKKTEP